MLSADNIFLGSLERKNVRASEFVLSGALGSSPKRDHENVGAHDPLVVLIPNSLGDVKQAGSVFDLGRLVDKITGFNGGHILAPPTHIATLGFTVSCMSPCLTHFNFARVAPDRANARPVAGTLPGRAPISRLR